MQQVLSYLTNDVIYVVAAILGLYVQYQVAKANARTTAETFWQYWFKETPGMSMATAVVLVTVLGGTIQSGMLSTMAAWAVLSAGFLAGYAFDAIIQAPPAKASK